MPLFLGLLYVLAVQFNITESINDVGGYHQNNVNAFNYFISHCLTRDYTPQWLIQSVRQITSNFNINLAFEFSDVFAWGLWVQVLHLLFDVMVFMFNFIHNILDGIGGKNLAK